MRGYLIIYVIIILLIPSAARAQGYGTDNLYGEVQSIDRDKMELVVNKSEDDSGRVFSVVKVIATPETRFTSNGLQVQLADLSAGDNVRIACEITTDGCKALTVAVEKPETVR